MEKHKHEEHRKHSEQKENHTEEKNTDKKHNESIIAEKDKKINELTDKYLRALAELDNFRKRMAKEKQEFEKNTKNEAINIFLPVYDNLERAVSVIDTTKDIESLKKGIEMVLKQFGDILKEMGVKEIETKGVFNPEFHQVLHKEEAIGKQDGEILEVYQKGYVLEGKIIRPALVKVAFISDIKAEPETTEKNKI